MATITTINGSDTITSSRTVINTNFSNLNSDKIETSVIDTDTALTANSDAKLPSQKAVKAYVDASVNSNASESARGIVEEATDAEVSAGTATGGTGAKLFVTPAKLATRLTAAFVDKLSASGATGSVTNTTTETNVFSVSVPAGALGTSNAIRAILFVSNFNYQDTNATLTVRAKYGSTTLASLIIDPSGGDTTAAQNGRITFTLIANASASAQSGILEADLYKNQLNPVSTTAVAFTKAMATGTATENSAGALNLIISVQWGTADAQNDFDYRGYVIETIA